MTELSPEEEAALVEALGTRVDFTHVRDASNLYNLGLIVLRHYMGGTTWVLTNIGRLLAQALRDLADARKRSGELERAQGLLREWETTATCETQGHRFGPTCVLNWEQREGWWVTLSCPRTSDQLWEHVVEVTGPESDSPLTAVIEASKQTPWPVGAG